MLLAIIPARGGSKGIPGKNLTLLNGRPLIEYTIVAAQKSKSIDEILLSTDDEKIADIGRGLGLNVTYVRPIELAQDNTPMIDALEDGLFWMKSKIGQLPDDTILLQPTSPLRSVSDIDNAVALFYESSATFVVSVHEMSEHPYECVSLSEDGWRYLVEPPFGVTRRQDYQYKFNFINGAIYIAKTSELLEKRCFINSDDTRFFVMPRERGIDVDEYVDLIVAEAFLKFSKEGG